jgi:flagellar basal-body rod protein FlgF
MLRGLYTAAAGMITQQRKHDTITNNISNINTPGYKQDVAVSRSFPDMLISLMNGTENQRSVNIGHINSGVFIEEKIMSMLPGDVLETGSPSDFALVSDMRMEGVQFDGYGKAVTEDGERIYQPQAFFTLMNDSGETRYTRNGQFQMNGGGELVTIDGSRLLGVNMQPIVLDRPLEEVHISPSGQLLDRAGQAVVNAATGEPLSFLISRVNDPNQLVSEGAGRFRLHEDAEGAEPADPNDPNDIFEVRQGFTERANVDPAQSMVDLMTALRIYETNQKVIQFYDRSLEKAVNEVGRIG